MTRPVIIGGGVTGLSIGWHLTRLGFKPLLLEKSTIGSGATGAAAGMVTPVSEARFGEEKLTEAFLRSHRLYPQFIRELEQASGMEVGFNRRGSLLIAIDPDDEAELLRLHDYQKELGLAVEKISRPQVQQTEPLLSANFSLALLAHDEYFLEANLLAEALKRAFVKGGGEIAEHRVVTRIETQSGRVTSVEAGKERINANTVILASGIDAALVGLPAELSLPIRPVKGQLIELKRDPARIPQGLNRMVRTVHRYPVYLVPRPDGRITLGATSEEMGLDARVTAGAQLDLLSGAWKILPAIEDMEITRSWTGFRPATRDHLPILGTSPIDGLHLAMGMYRHGILLAPLVGKQIADRVAGNSPDGAIDQFSWKRFQKK